MPTAPNSGTAGVRDFARRYPLALVSLGVLLYSTGPVLLQASSVSGPVFSFWRLWMGAAILGAATAVQARRTGWPEPRAWRFPAMAGVAFGTHQLLFFSAVKFTSVADVSLMNTLAPLVTAVGAAWLFSERPGARFLLWSTIAIAGAAVIVFGGASGPQGDPVGMTMAALNVLAFAVFFLLSKKSRDHLPVLPFLFGTMVVAALSVSLFVAAAGQAVGSVTTRDLVLAGIVAAFPGAVGHFVMTWPLRWVPANIPPVLKLAQPIFSALLALWWLAEPITWFHVVGGAIVLSGVGAALLSRDGRQLRRAANDSGAADEPAHGRLATVDGGG